MTSPHTVPDSPLFSSGRQQVRPLQYLYYLSTTNTINVIKYRFRPLNSSPSGPSPCTSSILASAAPITPTIQQSGVTNESHTNISPPPFTPPAYQSEGYLSKKIHLPISSDTFLHVGHLIPLTPHIRGKSSWGY